MHTQIDVFAINTTSSTVAGASKGAATRRECHRPQPASAVGRARRSPSISCPGAMDAYMAAEGGGLNQLQLAETPSRRIVQASGSGSALSALARSLALSGSLSHYLRLEAAAARRGVSRSPGERGVERNDSGSGALRGVGVPAPAVPNPPLPRRPPPGCSEHTQFPRTTISQPPRRSQGNPSLQLRGRNTVEFSRKSNFSLRVCLHSPARWAGPCPLWWGW
jgi:hypothetical protein